MTTADYLTEALAALPPATLAAMRRVLDRHAHQTNLDGRHLEADVWRAIGTVAADIELRRRSEAGQLHRQVYGTAEIIDDED